MAADARNCFSSFPLLPRHPLSSILYPRTPDPFPINPSIQQSINPNFYSANGVRGQTLKAFSPSVQGCGGMRLVAPKRSEGGGATLGKRSKKSPTPKWVASILDKSNSAPAKTRTNAVRRDEFRGSPNPAPAPFALYPCILDCVAQ